VLAVVGIEATKYKMSQQVISPGQAYKTYAGKEKKLTYGERNP
jgi:hypothetical protein